MAKCAICGEKERTFGGEFQEVDGQLLCPAHAEQKFREYEAMAQTKNIPISNQNFNRRTTNEGKRFKDPSVR